MLAVHNSEFTNFRKGGVYLTTKQTGTGTKYFKHLSCKRIIRAYYLHMSVRLRAMQEVYVLYRDVHTFSSSGYMVICSFFKTYLKNFRHYGVYKVICNESL